MTRVVDVHAHVTPERFRSAVSGGGTWHGLGADVGELENPRNSWTVERRLEEMDELGVDVQVVSPTDCFYQYGLDARRTAAIAADANEAIAEVVRERPRRFVGLGTLPMQDVDRATAELTRAIRELGLAGAMIDDHVNGRSYDEDGFADLWAAAEELEAFVLVHQYAPTTVASRIERYFLENSVGNLVDRTLSFAALVYGGVLDRHPRLRVCLAHAGGYVPFAVDRMDKAWDAFPGLRGEAADRPSAYLRRFFYDTVTFTERNLRFLRDAVGADRILFGSDYPAPMQVDDPVRRLRSLGLFGEAELHAVLGGTAEQVLRARVPAGPQHLGAPF